MSVPSVRVCVRMDDTQPRMHKWKYLRLTDFYFLFPIISHRKNGLNLFWIKKKSGQSSVNGVVLKRNEMNEMIQFLFPILYHWLNMCHISTIIIIKLYQHLFFDAIIIIIQDDYNDDNDDDNNRYFMIFS